MLYLGVAVFLDVAFRRGMIHVGRLNAIFLTQQETDILPQTLLDAFVSEYNFRTFEVLDVEGLSITLFFLPTHSSNAVFTLS